MYKLVLSDEARRTYEKAQVPLARKLAKCFARLEDDPRAGNNVKALTGQLAGLWRYRVGDHRIV
jgi:mRNA interferase RelE/StbE